MAVQTAFPLITKGYGLKSEYLDEFILRERMRDISKTYSREISEIQKRFSVHDRIRILEFDERIGSTREANTEYNELIAEGTHIFYCGILSNRDCCVIFLYTGLEQEEKRLLPRRILPHEYAHHYQFAKEGFPSILSKNMPKEMSLEFAGNAVVGSEVREFSIDGVKAINFDYLIKDMTERISDFVCERILLKMNFSEMLLDQYRQDTRIDPVKRNQHLQIPPSLKKYVKRLSLIDEAIWQSHIRKSYSDLTPFKYELEYNKNWVLRLNKDFPGRKKAFREILLSAYSIDYNEFKNVDRLMDYIYWLSKLIGIEIKA